MEPVTLIQRRFAEKEAPEGEIALTKYEEKPEIWEAPLKDALVETETHKAGEVLEAAEALKHAVERTPGGSIRRRTERGSPRNRLVFIAQFITEFNRHYPIAIWRFFAIGPSDRGRDIQSSFWPSGFS